MSKRLAWALTSEAACLNGPETRHFRFTAVLFSFVAGPGFLADLVGVDRFGRGKLADGVLEASLAGLETGSLFLTALTAFDAVRTVPGEMSVLPLAARLPMMVPAIAPATAPIGPAMTPPTMAPATPPAVCLDTGRLLLGCGAELFLFMRKESPTTTEWL